MLHGYDPLGPFFLPFLRAAAEHGVLRFPAVAAAIGTPFRPIPTESSYPDPPDPDSC